MKITKATCKVQVEHLGGAKVRYIWKCGHSRTEEMMVGPKGRGGKRFQRPMATDLMVKMVRYWNAAGGLNSEECPTCAKKTKS